MSQKINWFPGHMAKATRQVKEKLKLVDLILELRDARVPRSSANPQLKQLLSEQEIITLLTKADLAQPEQTQAWLEELSSPDTPALAIAPTSGYGIGGLKSKLSEVYHKLKDKREEKGLQGRPLRVMVVGLPNIGKSTLINALAGGSKAKTGRKPGVTRGQQWIKVSKEVQLLDTPGLLWPNIEDKEQGYKLAFCGMVRPEVVDSELLACKLLDYIRELNPEILYQRYDLDHLDGHSYDILADIGRNRGFLMSGGKVDRERAARTLIQEFQDGQLGRITFEVV